ncbi:unnamed protein product [Schistocephalus solidus]|uniref:Secreted protein n=1 Tax=Schistocephalus solidus TaxID=70667 RepID=A0A183SVD5_SCHSO|nr:unnamed protein product [Schistocephalus solidus]
MGNHRYLSLSLFFLLLLLLLLLPTTNPGTYLYLPLLLLLLLKTSSTAAQDVCTILSPVAVLVETPDIAASKRKLKVSQCRLLPGLFFFLTLRFLVLTTGFSPRKVGE